MLGAGSFTRSCTSPSLGHQNRSDIDESAGPEGLMMAHPGTRLVADHPSGPPLAQAVLADLWRLPEQIAQQVVASESCCPTTCSSPVGNCSVKSKSPLLWSDLVNLFCVLHFPNPIYYIYVQNSWMRSKHLKLEHLIYSFFTMADWRLPTFAVCW